MTGRDRTCDAPRFRRALYRLSFDHVDGQGWTRTSSLLFVRQALYPLSYSPEIRDKGSNLDLHVQSVVSCRLDDPGMVVRAYVTLGSMPNDVFHASRLPFNPGSPSVRCALCDGRRPTWRSFGARCSVADGKSAC